MKSVFVTVFEGVESKNILRTAILPTLLSDPRIQLVLLVKNQERARYLGREFTDPRISFEVIDLASIKGWDAVFRRLRFWMLCTETTALRRRMRYQAGQPFIAYLAGRMLNRVLARPLVRSIVRRLDFILVRQSCYTPLFDRYEPALVVCANLFDELEVHLVREAKRRGVYTVGFINSWDKPTARSALRMLPDQFVVFNSLVKADLVRYHDVAPERIFVGGIPQYDQYFSLQPCTRTEFFRRLKLDPSTKLIVYSPIGSAFSDSDWEMIDLLEELRSSGRFGKAAELLVRFSPNEFIDQDEISKRPWLRFQYPGVRFSKTRGIDWDMSSAELEELANTLSHMSLLVCYASSISVDAAVLDKPVININFEVRPAPYLAKSPTQFYQMAHYRPALASGGIRLVKSADELAAWVCRYLTDPTLDASGRRELARSQSEFLDGKSGERIGKFILGHL